MRSVAEVRCQLTVVDNNDNYMARGYHVPVSNDGVTYSEEDVLVIHDSNCVPCVVDGSTVTCNVQVNRTLYTF